MANRRHDPNQHVVQRMCPRCRAPAVTRVRASDGWRLVCECGWWVDDHEYMDERRKQHDE